MKRYASCWCALIISDCIWVGRIEEPGRYISRSSFVKSLLSCVMMPEDPASSVMRVEKCRGLPGGLLICFVCVSNVAISCSSVVNARCVMGSWPICCCCSHVILTSGAVCILGLII